MPICEICGAPTKNTTLKRHLASKKHLTAVNKSMQDVLTQTIVAAKEKQQRSPSQNDELIQRIEKLEKQLKDALERISMLETLLDTANQN